MQSNRPLLSVLVPAYNADAYLDDCIRSILVQTYDQIEVLICDDGSADMTRAVMNSFQDPRISVFKNRTNMGKNQTCSFLLERANGAFVTVHDADDISAVSRFEKQMTFLVENPEYAMCGTNFISFLDNGKVIKKSKLATDYDAIRVLIKERSQFHGPTVVMKKSIIPDVGGFYRYFIRAEDVDLTMRIAEKFKVANLSDHLYFYRHQPRSLTNHIEGYGIERLAHFSLLYYLAGERYKNNGVDSLMVGDTVKVQQIVDAFKKEFQADPDIALRRGVFRLLHMKMFRNAVHLSWNGMLANPGILNIKCFVYAFLHSIKGWFDLLFYTERLDLSFLKQPEAERRQLDSRSQRFQKGCA